VTPSPEAAWPRVKTLRALPEAEEELAEAAEWYEAKRTGLGVELIAIVDYAFEEILDAPPLYALWRADGPYRRLGLRWLLRSAPGKSIPTLDSGKSETHAAGRRFSLRQRNRRHAVHRDDLANRQPGSTIKKRFPSMSRKKNCGGTGSPTATSIDTSPDLRFPLRAMPSSTSTPRARRVAWSDSMSSVANAQ
jgi:hypothetical protein